MPLEAGHRQVKREGLVYVVDNDSALRRSLCRLLSEFEIHALDFGDSQHFLDAFDPNTPACVIVDPCVPQLNGFELQERLQIEAPAAKVIFCTADGNIAMSVRAMQQGVVNFLEKPYDSHRMIDVVQETLDVAAGAFAANQRRQSVIARLVMLTNREREVLRLVVKGLSSKQIARSLGTSVKTINVHRARIKSKSDADSIGTLMHDILQTDAPI